MRTGTTLLNRLGPSPERDYARLQQRAGGYQTNPKYRAAVLLSSARTRAAKHGLPFDFTIGQLAAKLSRGTCERTGLTFVLDKGKHPLSPSLDRIDPKKGYTPDNVQLVCWMYNAAKHTFTDADVLTFARALVLRQDQ